MSSNPPSEGGTASAARTNAKTSTGGTLTHPSRPFALAYRSLLPAPMNPTASTSQKANPFAPTRNTTARKPSPAPTKPEPSFARPTSASNNAPSEKPTRPARTASATGMGAPAMRPDPKKKPLSKSVSVAATARARDRERDREHTAPAPMARSTSQSWSTKPPLPPLPPRARGPASPDSLQVAAQFNAWVYLQGTLHSTFVSAQAAAKVRHIPSRVRLLIRSNLDLMV
ncbi:hypothetical protein OF83DRAFT_1178554 [Amylostereum chailletii]|nr:hypothetical protein OF83DRAFT_1178554 [Amylostereum chailletii]